MPSSFHVVYQMEINSKAHAIQLVKHFWFREGLIVATAMPIKKGQSRGNEQMEAIISTENSDKSKNQEWLTS